MITVVIPGLSKSTRFKGDQVSKGFIFTWSEIGEALLDKYPVRTNTVQIFAICNDFIRIPSKRIRFVLSYERR